MSIVLDGPNLSAWLAGRTPDELATILDRRPDAHWGAPLRGVDDLASRLIQPASVANSIAQLPMPGIELLHALSALGPRPTFSRAAALLATGDRAPHVQLESVRGALTILQDRALAWLTDIDTIAVNSGVRDVIGQPLGIGRTVASHLEHTPVEQLRMLLRNLGLSAGSRRADAVSVLEDFLTDHRKVRKLLATAPGSVRRRMQLLSTGDDTQTYHNGDQQDREGDNWARHRGLLFGGHYYAADVPVEVILAVRGDEITVDFNPEPPPLATQQVAPTAVAAAAAAAAAEFTETVAGLLDSISRAALPSLKAGGVGSREVSRVAKAMGTDDGRVRLALELAGALGLLTGVDAGIGPRQIAAGWRAGEPSARFADLAVAWWGLPVTPSISRDQDGKAVPAIGGRVTDTRAMDLRWAVLHTLGSLPPATGLVEVSSVAEHLTWQLPSVIDPQDPAITAIWREAHTLGVLAQGALTPIGSTLINGDPDALLSVAGQMLAPAATVGRFGSDLTVMVAGSPSAAVSALLDSCADRESRGAAVVWRFSPASVRRAFDEGSAADQLIGALRSIAETDLPQPLTYLIGDVQRRHGRLVVQPALCCVRSDEESLLIEIAAHRSLRSLRPHLLAPTVITFQAEAEVVLVALRAAGYLPVPAGETGVISLGRGMPKHSVDGAHPAERRTRRMVDQLPAVRSLPLLGSGGDTELTGALRELATALLSTTSAGVAADQNRDPTEAEEMIDAHGQHLDPVERRQLAFAVENQAPVAITYRSATGGSTTRTISDIELINGLMYAWCHLRDDERVFSIDRVQAVTPVYG